VAYLEDNANFISSKRHYWWMKQEWPYKKADLIRDMVVSISKIPDRIQRDLYSGMFSNYGYFRVLINCYGAIASEKLLR
jgi:hypothetical protein